MVRLSTEQLHHCIQDFFIIGGMSDSISQDVQIMTQNPEHQLNLKCLDEKFSWQMPFIPTKYLPHC